MLRKAALGAAVLLLVSAYGSSARAFCRTTTCDTCQPAAGGCVEEGVDLYWSVACISFDVQKDASRFADFATADEIARASFGAWANVRCPGGAPPSIKLVDSGPVECTKHEYNDQQNTYGGNANIVVFRDDEWNATADPHTLALTTVTYNKMSGEIYDADIEVNSHAQLGSSMGISTGTPVPPNSFDLQSILTHEAGHFLGMAHSDHRCQGGGDCPTMDAMYRTGSGDFRSLEQDDIEGICAIYPPARAAPEECSPRHGFAGECGTAGHRGCSFAAGSVRARSPWVAALVALALSVARGRRSAT